MCNIYDERHRGKKKKSRFIEFKKVPIGKNNLSRDGMRFLNMPIVMRGCGIIDRVQVEISSIFGSVIIFKLVKMAK